MCLLIVKYIITVSVWLLVEVCAFCLSLLTCFDQNDSSVKLSIDF